MGDGFYVVAHGGSRRKQTYMTRVRTRRIVDIYGGKYVLLSPEPQEDRGF